MCSRSGGESRCGRSSTMLTSQPGRNFSSRRRSRRRSPAAVRPGTRRSSPCGRRWRRPRSPAAFRPGAGGAAGLASRALEVPPGGVQRRLGELVAAERRQAFCQMRAGRIDARPTSRGRQPIAEQAQRAGGPFVGLPGGVAGAGLAPARRHVAVHSHQDGFQCGRRAAQRVVWAVGEAAGRRGRRRWSRFAWLESWS